MTRPSAPYLRGQRIEPTAISGQETAAALIDNAFLAYNAGRLREGCQLFTERMLEPDTTVGMTLTGALTPAGLGMSCLIPLMEAGFVDWIVSTGANLYHDAHFALGLAMHRGTPAADDVELRDEGVIRIYDIVFDYERPARHRRVHPRGDPRAGVPAPDGHGRVPLPARRIRPGARAGPRPHRANRCWPPRTSCEVPIYTSSPGDSSIGMNVAALALAASKLRFDVSARRERDRGDRATTPSARAGRAACCILGGGSPKNFMLQTEPQIQEVLGIDERGHDYFLQITDARPDTGGLSGATPAEAVTWGKIDPDQLPGTVVCYADTTIALPLLTAYAKAKRPSRPLKRLFGRRQAMMDRLVQEYRAALAFRDERAEESLAHMHPGAGGAETVARR